VSSHTKLSEFNALLEEIGDGVPDGAQYQRMSSLILDFPEAHKLAAMDPFAPGYKEAALKLYLFIRGRPDEGYVPVRDEAPVSALPANLWTGLIPWSFQDAAMVSEHLQAWGHILAHLNLPKGGSLLEYGPGSGQLLLMAARMGYRAYGVDIDAVSLQGINAQAAHLDLPLATERAEFGAGFDGQKFDAILFYEAFHHAFEFEDLLVQLHDRLNPGGRVVLCGEPIVGGVSPGIPYAWGPRLDALSVFCIRRFGWMELGFTHEYFMEIARRCGWHVAHYPSSGSGRAMIYVLTPGQNDDKDATGRRAKRQSPHSEIMHFTGPLTAQELRMVVQIRSLQTELAQVHASTSWRLTAPVRLAKTLILRIKSR
jgi:SAM-dependent methyltransferase